MSARRRRFVAAVLTLGVLVAVAASQRAEAPPRQLFRVTLGLTDERPTEWDGQMTVEGGEVADLKGWRFQEKDAVTGTAGWKCRTRLAIAPGARYPLAPADGKAPAPPQRPWPNGVLLTVRGNAPTVTVTLKQGEVRFRADEVTLGSPKTFLDGRVRVERLPVTSVLRPAAPPRAEAPVQDDYPAFWVRYRTNKHYLAVSCAFPAPRR
jgi:hypothetical protein